MLIFIHGEDTFRAKEKVKELKERFQEKFDPTGLNFLEFKTRPEIGEAMAAVGASPFMGQRRMVLFRELLSGLKKAEIEIWAAAFVKTPESTIVVCLESKEPPSIANVESHVYAFPLLTDRELPRWIIERAKALNMEVEPSAVQELVVRVGPDLWRMQGELEKLAACSTTVTYETVRSLVAPSFGDQLFDLMDAVSAKDRPRVARLLQEERLRGTTDAHLLSMLIRQVRILLGARALIEERPTATKQDFASALDLHPFVAQKAMSQARVFPLSRLKAAHEQLFDFERRLKHGAMEFNLAVDLFITHFIS